MQRGDSNERQQSCAGGARLAALAQQEAVQLLPCRRLLRLRPQQAAQSPFTPCSRHMQDHQTERPVSACRGGTTLQARVRGPV